MQTYRITLAGGLEAAGIPGPAEGAHVVSATTPAVALKRLLDGGHKAGYKFATVSRRDSDRLALDRGQHINILIERIS